MTKILFALLLLLFCVVYAAHTRLEWPNADPFNYIHAAQTLRAGRGLRMIDGTPLTIWPPFIQYPSHS